jgi:hypothetical protein
MTFIWEAEKQFDVGTLNLSIDYCNRGTAYKVVFRLVWYLPIKALQECPEIFYWTQFFSCQFKNISYSVKSIRGVMRQFCACDMAIKWTFPHLVWSVFHLFLFTCNRLLGFSQLFYHHFLPCSFLFSLPTIFPFQTFMKQ